MSKVKCPNCGKTLTFTAEYPDTGTSVDIYEAKCKTCKSKFVVSVENQDGSISVSEAGD